MDEVNLMRVDPIRVKVMSRDPSNINCFVEVFINSVGYEIKFETEGGARGKKKIPIYDHFNKFKGHRKDDDDEDDEAKSNDSDRKTEWEKIAEKFDGDTLHSSDQKSWGGSAKTRGKQHKGIDHEEEDSCSDLMGIDSENQVFAIVPLAYSFPELTEQNCSGLEKIEEGEDSLKGCDQVMSPQVKGVLTV